MEKRITHREWLDIFPEAREYLEADLEFQEKKLDLQQQIYSNQLDIINVSKRREQLQEDAKGYLITYQIYWIKKLEAILNEDFKTFWGSVADHFLGKDIQDTEKIIKEINRYIYIETPNSGRIGEREIQNARDYPFENLIDVKRNFALCPFHQDKSPSFYVKNNFGHCFSCGKTVDTIAFIMETEGLNFIQAVKRLN